MGGHQRVKVLKELGIKEIEAVVVRMDEKDEMKLNVLLNRARGFWDSEKLAPLLQELNDYGDIEITGFDEWELQGILDELNQLDDILDFEAEQDEDEETEEEMFDMTFAIPAEYAEAAECRLADASAQTELAAIIVDLVRGGVNFGNS